MRRPRLFWITPVRAAVALALALFCPELSAQQVYKWVDGSGTTHYTEQPLPDGKSTRIELAPAGAGAAMPRPPDHPDMVQNDRRQSDYLCGVARNNLKVLKGKGMVVKGGMQDARQLDAGDRAGAGAEAAAQVARYCRKP